MDDILEISDWSIPIDRRTTKEDESRPLIPVDEGSGTESYEYFIRFNRGGNDGSKIGGLHSVR